MKLTTTMSEFALDTNILVYAHENNEPEKQEKAVDLIRLKPFVSSQTVSEYINVLRRKLPVSKDLVLYTVRLVLVQTRLCTVSDGTLNLAIDLIRKYQFQIFDAIIIASALEAGCTILYSEDMQHGQLIDDRLRIVNPFL